LVYKWIKFVLILVRNKLFYSKLITKPKMKILGISCITNMAAGILDQPLSHEEVFETANTAGKKFTMWVKQIITNW